MVNFCCTFTIKTKMRAKIFPSNKILLFKQAEIVSWEDEILLCPWDRWFPIPWLSKRFWIQIPYLYFGEARGHTRACGGRCDPWRGCMLVFLSRLPSRGMVHLHLLFLIALVERRALLLHAHGPLWARRARGVGSLILRGSAWSVLQRPSSCPTSPCQTSP